MNEEARARALRILEKRDVSRRMLLDKLTEKGCSDADAEEVADWLCELGVVDDKRFAALVARHYAARGYGRRRICDELYRRGISRELWDEALEEMPQGTEALDKALRSRLRGQAAEGDALRKASAALMRRGWSWEEVRAAVERYRPDGEITEEEEV